MTLTTRGALVIATIVVWYLMIVKHGIGHGWWVVPNLLFGILLVGFIGGMLMDWFGEKHD